MKWHRSFLIFFSMLMGLTPNGLRAQVPNFTLPVSVCVNAPVQINNTSQGGTSFYWNFCSADLNQAPEAVNLGNIGGVFQTPVFLDVVSENGNYYGFLTNHDPGGLVRLDFGNSMLNTPTATNMGNFGGIINAGAGTEGIQVIKSNGKWYALIVGGDFATGGVPKIVRISFGASITNPNPVATDWGDLGNMSQAVGYYMFNEQDHWYGLTVNATNSTMTRFDFGTDLENPPVALNLGNPGGVLQYPTGICAINDAGFWRVFIISSQNNRLIRLDYGNSLLNTPVIVDLGNPGNVFNAARDLRIIKSCDQVIGFIAGGNNTQDLIKLDFNNDLTSTPTGVSLGNIGNFNFPHSLSTLFRVGPDLYSFLPNAFNNTLSRIRFPGCSSANLPNSSLVTPPPVSWSVPGTYRINMIMDDGLPTQTSFCQTINVLAAPAVEIGNDTALCTGDSLVLRYTGPLFPLRWQDGSSLDTFAVHNAGKYKLSATNAAGCIGADSIAVRMVTLPFVKTIPDTAICQGDSLMLSTVVQQMDSIRWDLLSYAAGGSLPNPEVAPGIDTRYIVTAWHEFCPSRDTVMVTLKDTPRLQVSADTLICTGGTARLLVTGADHYQWSPAGSLSDPLIPAPLASPGSNTRYHVLATGTNSCTTADSVMVSIKVPDVFGLSPGRSKLCQGDTLLLLANGADPALGDTYEWLLGQMPQNPSAEAIEVWPPVPTTYHMVGYDSICAFRDTLAAFVNVVPNPTVTLSKSNDIDCIYGQAQLTAAGGIRYTWSPAATLTNPGIANPLARTDTSTLYRVRVTDANGCSTLDSIMVLATKEPGSIGFPVANAFSPNGDGNNDCFGIKYWGYIGDFEMSVFDRWGVRVYTSKDPYQCWDGRYRGQLQPAGAYVYTIRVTALCGTAFRKGTVTLLR